MNIHDLDPAILAAHQYLDANRDHRALAALNKSKDKTAADYLLCRIRVLLHLGDWESAWKLLPALRAAEGFTPAHEGDFVRYRSHFEITKGTKGQVPGALEALKAIVENEHAENPNRRGLDLFVSAIGNIRLRRWEPACQACEEARKAFAENPDGKDHPRYKSVLWLAFLTETASGKTSERWLARLVAPFVR